VWGRERAAVVPSVRVVTLVATIVAVLAISRTAVAPQRLPQREQVPSLFTEAPGEPAPELTSLFAPARAPQGAYVAYATPESLTRVIAWYERERLVPRDGWRVQSLLSGEIFGIAASVDRWKLATLFGARRARVGRTTIAKEGQVLRSITMVSPYPSAELDRLLEGTLVLVFRVPSSAARARRQREDFDR
jgi:outer membrane biosynthesis protein TonB